MELTKEQKDLLDVIMNDKYANGAFCGMIYNQVTKSDAYSDAAIESEIILALRIRLLAMELSK